VEVGRVVVGQVTKHANFRGLCDAAVWSSAGVPTDLNLNSPGYAESRAVGIEGNQQAGERIVNPNVSAYTDAFLWIGSAYRVIVLTPQDYFDAQALSTNGSQQVGSAQTFRAKVTSAGASRPTADCA
jgi:hypothetical protein